jgi:hypothetical protein
MTGLRKIGCSIARVMDSALFRKDDVQLKIVQRFVHAECKFSISVAIRTYNV